MPCEKRACPGVKATSLLPRELPQHAKRTQDCQLSKVPSSRGALACHSLACLSLKRTLRV